MEITQTDIDLALSSIPHSHIKFLVYDESDTLLDELTGYATSFTWNNLSDSDIRRTANVTMYVPDKSYLVESSSVVWLDNKVKIYVGLENASGVITWYIVGTYLFSDSSYTFNETTQEMAITLIDMMACTTEKRGSQINGIWAYDPRWRECAQRDHFSHYRIHTISSIFNTGVSGRNSI